MNEEIVWPLRKQGIKHFITAIGYDDTYIYANDPNKSAAPRKQAQSKFKSCMKQAFIFWPKLENANKPEDNAGGGTKVAATTQTTQTAMKKSNGTAIIDISKWQGKIDFDKLKEAVALVIVRASCGSDKDVKFDEYAKAMKDKGIPFGVYCYSYAGTTAKAKDEVQKMVSYAKTYKPLFYVMDAEESKITNESISAFADELKAQKIKKFGCYVAHNHYKDYDYDSVKSKFGFTWIPRYGKNDGTVEGSTKPSYKCDLWQYTSTGKIAGIKGKVDMNVITGDGHDLDWFLS